MLASWPAVETAPEGCATRPACAGLLRRAGVSARRLNASSRPFCGRSILCPYACVDSIARSPAAAPFARRVSAQADIVAAAGRLQARFEPPARYRYAPSH